jgi:flavin reductase (DIM6/NTAB) family NADH-FMN oxidoreductase RutF
MGHRKPLKGSHESGLDFEPSKALKTPSIRQGYAHLECILYRTENIGDHTFFIGEVINVSCKKDAFKETILNPQTTRPTFYLGDFMYSTLSTEGKTHL